jgi:hypothetical protein
LATEADLVIGEIVEAEAVVEVEADAVAREAVLILRGSCPG